MHNRYLSPARSAGLCLQLRKEPRDAVRVLRLSSHVSMRCPTYRLQPCLSDPDEADEPVNWKGHQTRLQPSR